MSNISIRPARPTDVPAITRIYAHAVRHGTASFELEPPDEAEMGRRMTAILAGKFPYIVAEIEGTIAGYAYASFYRTRPAYRFTVENSVYVAPEMHRRGIGKLLLQKLIEECTARGFRQMIAVIGDSDQAASIGVHKACGFEPAGNLRNIGWKFGRWLDTPLMQLALGPGGASPPDAADANPSVDAKSAGKLHRR
ncbi:MAG TPA: GNAT family N-acetyltransferase [Pseudolabrys sp.]|nr:GNAT family N-acetyltransferase [Pseudolabrys sp.]